MMNNDLHLLLFIKQTYNMGQDILISCLFYSKFRLSYYPHRLESFKELLKAAFFGKCKQKVYGDFKHYTPGQGEAPCYFIHVVEKTA